MSKNKYQFVEHIYRPKQIQSNPQVQNQQQILSQLEPQFIQQEPIQATKNQRKQCGKCAFTYRDGVAHDCMLTLLKYVMKLDKQLKTKTQELDHVRVEYQTLNNNYNRLREELNYFMSQAQVVNDYNYQKQFQYNLQPEIKPRDSNKSGKYFNQGVLYGNNYYNHQNLNLNYQPIDLMQQNFQNINLAPELLTSKDDLFKNSSVIQVQKDQQTQPSQQSVVVDKVGQEDQFQQIQEDLLRPDIHFMPKNLLRSQIISDLKLQVKESQQLETPTIQAMILYLTRKQNPLNPLPKFTAYTFDSFTNPKTPDQTDIQLSKLKSLGNKMGVIGCIYSDTTMKGKIKATWVIEGDIERLQDIVINEKGVSEIGNTDWIFEDYLMTEQNETVMKFNLEKQWIKKPHYDKFQFLLF